MTYPTKDEVIQAKCIQAAKKAGIDLSALRVVSATLDQTWGRLVGYVVGGVEGDALARAVAWVTAYLHKHTGKTSYESQNSIGARGPYTACIARWNLGTYRELTSFEERGHIEYESTANYDVLEVIKGVGVAHRYYPCAE